MACKLYPLTGGGASETASASQERFWLKLVGKGRFKVKGSGMHAHGQQAYMRLRQEEALNAYLDCQGEPSFIEVRRVDPKAKPTVDLVYRSAANCGTVRVEPSAGGFLIARPIQPCAAPARAPRPAPAPAQSAPVCTATDAQKDECLFETWRQDCQDLCVQCDTYPWCDS